MKTMKAARNRILSLLLSATILLSLLPASAFAADFSDVPQNAYYNNAVNWAVENGITSGTGGAYFSPAESCNRAQTVTFLWRVAGQPKASGANPFTDVAADAYYYDAVLWAVENKITGGTSATTFEPNSPVTRAQAVTFLYRSAGEPTISGSNPFQDVASNAYYFNAVRWAVTEGITAGTSASTFAPNQPCTRAEIVTFLYRDSDDYVAPEPDTDTTVVEPEKPQELTDEEVQTLLGQPDIEGATAALINAFRQMDEEVALAQFNLETSAAQELAIEVSDFYGENPYYIVMLHGRGTVGKLVEKLEVRYQYTQEELAEKQKQDAEQQAAVDAAISSCVTSGMSDYEIAKALHDYLVLNNEYDMRYYSGNLPKISYTAYGALVNHTSVCAGYALAYQALLEQAGIPSEYVTGMTTRGYHAWNIVQIDGAWYHVDTTWDDPVPDRKGYVRYDYFLKSDSVLSKDHSNWSATHACTSTKYDNMTILSPEQEQQAQEDAEKQEQEEAFLTELLAVCHEQVDAFPYNTTEALQAAESITYDDVKSYIYIPADQYTFEDVIKAQKQLVIEWKSTHPEYAISGFDRNSVKDGNWYLTVIRNDILDEIDRREAMAQDEQAIHADEIELILQEVLQNATRMNYEYQVEGYTYNEIRAACSDMKQDGYAFGDYTNQDYSFSPQPSGKVIIVNYKWGEDETERQAEIIRAAIRSGQTEVQLTGQYDDSKVSEYYYAYNAAKRVGKDGYSFDGLTAGVDYTLDTVIRHDSNMETEWYEVRITYLTSEPTPETTAETQTTPAA